MKTMKLLLLLLILGVPVMVKADIVEEEPDMSDNTGALGVATEATTSVDIIQENQAATTGTKEGEITLYQSDSGVEVYSGLAKVEMIATGSDGWTGSIDVESGEIRYTPAGRPQLSCPAQNLAHWFGPCKIAENQN